MNNRDFEEWASNRLQMRIKVYDISDKILY